MKTSVISDAFRARYLSRAGPEGVFEGRASCSTGRTTTTTGSTTRPWRSTSTHPGDPGLRPDRLAGLCRGGQHAAARRPDPARHRQPADHRRRPPVGHLGQPVDPQRLAGKRGRRRPGLAADRRPIRIDLNAGRCDALVDEAEIARRKAEPAPPIPVSHTPWEELYSEQAGQLATGAVLESAVRFRGVARQTPRHNH